MDVLYFLNVKPNYILQDIKHTIMHYHFHALFSNFFTISMYVFIAFMSIVLFLQYLCEDLSSIICVSSLKQEFRKD